MPELPEVETVARQLAPPLVGNRVRELRILDPLLRESSARHGVVPSVAGRAIESVVRSGKQVLIAFGPGSRGRAPVWLGVHLRMTGRLIWTDANCPDSRTHLRARFRLARGRLLFLDTRRFGTFRWYRSLADAAPVGIDPLSPELSGRRFAALLAGARQNVKAWLLRQDRLVGLGNIYASEILYRAGVAPEREVASLTPDEVSRVYRSTRAILRRAIEACGTTFSDFQDARGVEGSYQQYLAVYGRANEPCHRCGTPIERIVQQQRSTFRCPNCQQ